MARTQPRVWREDDVKDGLADEAEASILSGSQTTTGYDRSVGEGPVKVADEIGAAWTDKLSALLLAALKANAEPLALIRFRRALAEEIAEQNACGVTEYRNEVEESGAQEAASEDAYWSAL